MSLVPYMWASMTFLPILLAIFFDKQMTATLEFLSIGYAGYALLCR